MSRWIVLAIPVGGIAEANTEARTVTELEGSSEEAKTALLQAAHTYTHNRWKVRRREIYQCSDRSYLLRLQGRTGTYNYLVQLAELVHDTAAEPTAQPPAEPQSPTSPDQPW
ncbi:hypothetical protein [Streptomyces sp. NPDC056452]|uniref:hypothetical protein n=1 Tax=Streptomyces sp. NPDC056452 TaxID=3345821 RepID=UPI00369D7761